MSRAVLPGLLVSVPRLRQVSQRGEGYPVSLPHELVESNPGQRVRDNPWYSFFIVTSINRCNCMSCGFCRGRVQLPTVRLHIPPGQKRIPYFIG